MAKFEEKFFVINNKVFKEMQNDWVSQNKNPYIREHPLVRAFEESFLSLKEEYEKVSYKKLDQKYYICNQDEPYAQQVIDIIIAGETEKES